MAVASGDFGGSEKRIEKERYNPSPREPLDFKDYPQQIRSRN
jgi:hypothetical protein